MHTYEVLKIVGIGSRKLDPFHRWI